jgi:predicted Rossmann fold nucleotide-binding protein DprA/Smf involved in DNA uptake
LIPLPSGLDDESDSIAAGLLRALDGGATQLDDLVAACQTRAPEMLAALTLLELDGRVERTGASTYARRR